MRSNRPLVFADLDDTFFQTARKMPEGAERHPATYDISGEPNGFMSATQKMFIEWLLCTADVVPVTARSVEAYSRVKIPFTSGAICSHGGVILGQSGEVDRDWHAHMTETLSDFQARLPELSVTTLSVGQELGFSLRGWVVDEADLLHYVVTKHNESDDTVLTKVCAEVQARGVLEGMHIHGNGNNLAFLPNGLAKRFAVEEWLRRDRAIHGERLVIGLGDSITDLGFMDACDFWGTPARSQLAKVVDGLLHA